MEKPQTTCATVQAVIAAVVATWEERRQRKGKGGKRALTQEALAVAADMHPMAYSRLVRKASVGGELNMSLAHFLRVEAVLTAKGAKHKSTSHLVLGLIPTPTLKKNEI